MDYKSQKLETFMEKTIKVDLTKEELYIIYSALNEICNITEIPDFELRIGYSEENVAALLKKISHTYDLIKQQNKPGQVAEMNLTFDELYLINVSLNEICNGIDIPEFELRIGYPMENALLIFKKINDFKRDLYG